MFTPQERLSYLVASLENGNAAAFARKCGIPEASLSRLRNGKNEITMTYYTRILAAYPQVRREWLFAGVGEPTHEKQNKDLMLSEVAALRQDVAEIKKMLRALLER